MILGINSVYHESSAALIDDDGRIVAAAEEERFTGQKHAKSPRPDNAHHLPWLAIDYCLKEGGVTWRSLAAVAYSFQPELRQGMAYFGYDGDPGSFGYRTRETIFKESLERVPRIVRDQTRAPFYFVPHHTAHAWYAMGTSPLKRAAVLVADGIGERASLSCGIATRDEIELHTLASFPDSIGLLWEKLSRYVGLSEYDACKLMALAGTIGNLKPVPFARYLAFRDGELWVDQESLGVDYPNDFSGLDRVAGTRRGRPVTSNEYVRLAAGVQAATEQTLVAIASRLTEVYGERRVVYGGGVALNCRANEVVARSGAVDELHAGPATHDGGTALGAAWHVHTIATGRPVALPDPRSVLFSGPALVEDEGVLRAAGWAPALPPGLPESPDSPESQESQHPLDAVVDVLLRGEVVGWLDGRLEFGPRALGGRSILASPMRPDVAAHVNRLKGRHEFEPLACVVVEERAAELFDIPAPARDLAALMLTTARPTAPWRAALAHVLHQDGSARVQVVRRAVVPRLHELLLRLASRGGLPLLINTSYNPRGEPMPATLSQALPMAGCLGLSHLAVNGHLWTRTS